MLRFVISVSIILIFQGMNAYSQYMPSIIFWSAEAECGSKKVPAERNTRCRQFDENGETVWVIENGSVVVSFTLVNERARLVGKIDIANGSPEKIEYDPATWRMAHYGNEAEFLERIEPLATNNAFIVVERVSPMLADQGPASQGIVDIWRPGEFRNADIVRQSSRTDTIAGINPPTSPGSRATHIPRAPGEPKPDKSGTDKDARDASVKSGSNEVVSARTASAKSIFSSKQLSSKSVGSKKNANGIFYFGSVPDSMFKLVTINIGDTTYVFQVSEL